MIGEDLNFVYKMLFSFFMFCLIVATAIYFRNEYALENLLKNYSEITAITGGFTSSQYSDFEDDLKNIGLDPNETNITIVATAPDGTDITSQATNVTPTNISPYPSTPKYCPRGTKISITVISKRKAILSNIVPIFGATSNLSKADNKKVYMSERVK